MRALYIHIYIYIHTYTYIYIYIYICIFITESVSFVRVCLSVCVCVPVCLSVCLSVPRPGSVHGTKKERDERLCAYEPSRFERYGSLLVCVVSLLESVSLACALGASRCVVSVCLTCVCL